MADIKPNYVNDVPMCSEAKCPLWYGGDECKIRQRDNYYPICLPAVRLLKKENDRLKAVIQEAIDVMDEEPAKEALKEAIKESKNE